MEETQLIKTSLTIKLSTQSSAGLCLNANPDFKSSFQYTIPYMNLREHSIEYARYSVNHAIIPNSFYNINESNNRLDITYKDIILNEPVGTNVSYLFEVGNYNAITFKAHFLATLGENWTITLNNINNHFTISNALYSFDVNTSSTISSVMGFSSTLSSYTTPLGNSVEMTRVCNFMPTPRIHLRCSNLANSIMVGTKDNHTDILCSIPNDGKLNSSIVYHNYSNSSTLIDATYLHTLIVNITDENGFLLNFNGVASYFELSIDIFRKRLAEKPPTFKELIYHLSRHFD